MDSGSGYEAVIGESTPFLGTSFIVTEGIVEGNSYSFQVSARNIQGYSLLPSTPFAITASDIPDMMGAPIVSVDRADDLNLNATISWNAPDHNGEVIEAYYIEIKDNSGAFHIDSTNCDGSVDPVLTALQCSIPMATLEAAPFNLMRDDMI